jgi:hypothetical protein
VPAGVRLPGEAEIRVRAAGTVRVCTTAAEHSHPRSHDQIVFHFAGNDTGAATNAPAFIKYQTVLLITHLPDS